MTACGRRGVQSAEAASPHSAQLREMQSRMHTAAQPALGQHRQNNLSHFREFFVAKTIWGQFQFWRVRIKDINNSNIFKIVVILFFQQKIYSEILMPLLNTPLHLHLNHNFSIACDVLYC